MKNKYTRITIVLTLIIICFLSCKKETTTCVKCLKYRDKDFGSTENCVGDFYLETEEAFNNLVTELEKEGYKLTFSEKCETH